METRGARRCRPLCSGPPSPAPGNTGDVGEGSLKFRLQRKSPPLAPSPSAILRASLGLWGQHRDGRLLPQRRCSSVGRNGKGLPFHPVSRLQTLFLPIKARPLEERNSLTRLVANKGLMWHQEAGGPGTSRVMSHRTGTSLRASWCHCPAHCSRHWAQLACEQALPPTGLRPASAGQPGRALQAGPVSPSQEPPFPT